MATHTPTLIGLLNQQPENDAILYEEVIMTHNEVGRTSDYMAKNLIQQGIVVGDRVAVCVPPGPNLILSILGILKAGAVFVPLDTNIPHERVKFMLSDSSAKLCISDQPIKGFQTIDPRILQQPTQLGSLPEVQPSDTAYIIYTSGTTGKPKGVMVSHQAIYNYLQFAITTYLTAGEKEVMALITSPSVDMTLTSLLLPMISGNCLAIYHAGSNLQNLMSALQDDQVTFLKCTPTHLSLIGHNTMAKSRIRTLVVGGEALPASEALRMEGLFKGIKIYNEYGPTEATVGCTVHLFDPTKDRSYVAIGKPIPGTQIAILDQDLSPVVDGTAGELFIGGNCLAEGYLNHAKATTAKFIELDGQRYYRSGDTVQQRNGLLYYLGRQDDQVKVQGYRVEPGEITKVILTNPSIDNAVVKKEGDHLVAYLKTTQIDLDELIDFLSSKLPGWMVPSRYYLSDLWTTSANGKLDFAAMKANAQLMEPDAFTGPEEAESLTGEIRRMIISRSRMKHLDKGTNLFDAGLESIQLVNLIVDLEEKYDCRIGMGPVVANPTLESIVAATQTARHRQVFSRFNNDMEETPVYCFPAAIGGPMAFRGLIKADRHRPYRTLEDPARFLDPLKSYADAIEAAADFPCILLGYSGGGNLAFEVCKILEARGKSVAAIIMLDAFRKRYIPKAMPEDIRIMKEEAMSHLGSQASPSVVEDLSRYYDLVNFELHDYEGSVKTDVYLITSENRESFGNRKVAGIPFFHPWANCTNGRFAELQGAGNHEEMLRDPALTTNQKIIQEIINAYLSA